MALINQVMSRYKDYVQKMLSENKELLDEFKTIHDEYSLNPEKWHNEVRKIFPMIDYVGIRVITDKIQKNPDFQIKKINL